MGWGAHPTNRGPCRYCDRTIAWGYGLHGVFLLEPKPYAMGTIVVRNNGIHLADLGDSVLFDPRLLDLAPTLGIPLYRRHRHSGLHTRGRPVRISETLPQHREPDGSN